MGSFPVTGEYIRPLLPPSDKQEPLSTKPAFLSRSVSPRCRFESDVSLVQVVGQLPWLGCS